MPFKLSTLLSTSDFKLTANCQACKAIFKLKSLSIRGCILKNEHIKLIYDIRKEFEKIDEYRNLFDKTSHWKEFPRGRCKSASFILLSYFRLFTSVDPQRCALVANAIIVGQDTHAWIMIEDTHVDITGDQFGAEPVIISKDNPWPMAEKSMELFFNETANDKWQTFFDNFAVYLHSKITKS